MQGKRNYILKDYVNKPHTLIVNVIERKAPSDTICSFAGEGNERSQRKDG